MWVCGIAATVSAQNSSFGRGFLHQGDYTMTEMQNYLPLCTPLLSFWIYISLPNSTRTYTVTVFYVNVNRFAFLGRMGDNFLSQGVSLEYLLALLKDNVGGESFSTVCLIQKVKFWHNYTLETDIWLTKQFFFMTIFLRNLNCIWATFVLTILKNHFFFQLFWKTSKTL